MPIPGLSRKTYSPQVWKKSYPLRQQRVSYLSHPTSQRKKPKAAKIKTLFKCLLALILISIIFGGFGSLAMLAWVSKDLPNPDKIIERAVPLSTKIYDREGKTILYDIHGRQKRTMVELSEIPDYLKQATLIAEDRRFYEHQGFNFTSIIRAALVNLLRGGKAQGASTLTQQLVKNAILTPEKTYTRKLKELILAYQIEKRFSKDQILKMYFNEIPYGSTAYGVEAAAQTYFGKSVKEINLAEAAILAAITKAPTYYSPYGSHKEDLLARQHWILDSLTEADFITEAKAQAAKLTKLEFKTQQEKIIAPHLVMYVKEYLTQKYGEKTVEQGGLKVITTLDLNKQKLAEETITELAEKNLKYNANNAALVALDTKTGQILAMVGSKDYFNQDIDGQVNVVLRPRQPGSSFKPAVYAAAFRKSYTPDTILYDVNTQFINYDQKIYEPHDYDLKERGPVTIRQALAGSLNIPAVKTIYLTGIDKVLDLAEQLGYATLKDRSRFGLSLVLGGGEVKLLEHVAAFATFAREGEYHPPVAILKVEDKDGQILEEFKIQETKVLETEIARQINDILSDNAARTFIFGQNNFLTLPDRPVAAKTGTTNDYRDAWTLGYTPSVAVGVWVGNNDFSEMKKGADGSVVAAPIWQSFMKKIHVGLPMEEFKKPQPIQTAKPVLNGSLKEGIKVKIDKISGQLATQYTPAHLIEEKTFLVAHSILYYLNKDDPQGVPPADPAADPQFNNWEQAVQDWARRQNLTLQEPPTETDNVHLPEYQPRLEILTPTPNQKIADRQFSVIVNADAPRGLRRLEYYLAGQLIGTVNAAPWNLNVYLADPNIKNGFDALTVAAYDDVDNAATKSVDVNLLLPELPPAVLWQNPKNNAIITPKEFPYPLQLQLNQLEKIAKLDFYFQPEKKSPQFINTIRQFAGNQINAAWPNYPGAGIYQLYAEITNTDGFIYQSEKIAVEIK